MAEAFAPGTPVVLVAGAVEAARSEVVGRIEKREPPFESAPTTLPSCDFDLVVPTLPEGWNVVA